MPVARRRADTTAAPALWTGWHGARGSQWQPLVTGGTYDEAWRALLAELGNGKSDSWLVLRVGRLP